jgi:hypothetical protein
LFSKHFYFKYAKTTVFDGGYGVRSRLNCKTDIYTNNEALARFVFKKPPLEVAECHFGSLQYPEN